MKRLLYAILITTAFFYSSYSTVFSEQREVYLSVYPAEIIQGEPFMITVEGVKDVSLARKMFFNDAPLGIFVYNGKPTALVGIDLRKKPGNYEISAKLSSGQVIKKDVVVSARKRIEAPLGIPAKLGGNTKESQDKLVSTLAEENRSLANLRTGTKAFWTEKFLYPLVENFVTDEYGYSRKTGEYSIAHKGTDFRAKEGTPVMAMNRGVVRVARIYRNYGNVIVIDHGLGLMTFYLHLSKMHLNEGELAKRGQVIGLSGQSGYAISPHLHLSVRINNNSVDPVKFLELFK